LLLELFVGQEGRGEDQEKRPAHPEAAAAEVEDQEGAEQAAEKELKRVDEPELGLGSVLAIRPLFPARLARRMQTARTAKCTTTHKFSKCGVGGVNVGDVDRQTLAIQRRYPESPSHGRGEKGWRVTIRLSKRRLACSKN
jgi:hypothetical protein